MTVAIRYAFYTRATDNVGNQEAAQAVADTTVSVGPAAAWHNPIRPLDVNNDDHISSIDALLVIDYLNNKLSSTVPPDAVGPPFYDTNGDDNVSFIDALLVINAINNGVGGEGEGSTATLHPLTSSSDILALLAVDSAEQSARRRRGL